MKDINATIIVDLKQNKEEIKKNLHKDARWGIGKAEKEGLVCEESKEIEDWIEFYKIYAQTMENQGLKKEKMDDLKKKITIFFICKKKDKIIAGAGIGFFDLYDKTIPQLYFNVSLTEYQKFQPNNLLYWNCILWAKEKNYNKFDFGGWQINARGHLQGINKFKEKWGKIVYYHKDYSFFKAMGRKLIRNSNFFWRLNKKIKLKIHWSY